MRVRFWGVRGSIASAGPSTAFVGGNTSCVEVRCGDRLIILDAGTGLRALGESLARGGEAVDATLLLSHVHWDHIQGFPFFAPAYSPASRIAIHAGCGDGTGRGVREALAAQMRAPHFPVGLDALRAQLTFAPVRGGDRLAIGEATVRAAQARHPGGCLAYRIEHEGRSLVYATDTEHPEGGALDEELAALADGADVLVYDAQYTPAEYEGAGPGPCRRGWGHSTADEGVRLARAAGVGRLILFHHDPAHDDAEVARIESEARAAWPSVEAAREGRVLALGPRLPGRVAA
jgi:phosphoribosyl 1,2-cyclic phosphodiesterase